MTAASFGVLLVLADDGWDMHGWGSGWWVVMLLGMVVFWALVILGIVWIVRELGSGRQQREPERPLDVLQRRLAEGDISVEEYERRHALLEPSD